MSCIIEPAKASELEAIHNLIYKRCVWFDNKGVKGWSASVYPNKYPVEYFKEQMSINKVFVAKVDGAIQGVMVLKHVDKNFWEDDEPAYYIHHLATDVESRGVGKQLIDFAIEQCKKDGKKYLRLDCYKDSMFLNSYYPKIGFKNAGYGTFKQYEYSRWELKI